MRRSRSGEDRSPPHDARDHEAEASARTVLESIADAVLVAAADRRYVDANPAACDLLGYSRTQLLRLRIDDVVAQGSGWTDADFARFFQAGQWRGDLELRRQDGSTVLVEARASLLELPEGRRSVSVLRDIGERQRAAARQRFLAEASAVLTAALDEQSTLADLARLAVPEIADACVVDMYGPDGHVHRRAVAVVDETRAAAIWEAGRQPLDPDAAHGPARVLRTGVSELVPVVTDALLVAAARSPEHLHFLREAGVRSHMIVPLRARGRTLGAITFVRASSERRYGREDLALAEELAGRAALAVDNARLYREAQDAQSRYATLFESAAEAIMVVDVDGYCVEANQAMTELIGYSAAELTGRRTLGLAATPDAPTWAEVELAHLQHGGSWRGELSMRRKDGSLVPVEAWATAVALPDGTVYLWLMRDIRRRILMEAGRQFLAEAGTVLTASLDYGAIVDRLVRLCVPRFADWCSIDRLEDGTIQRLAIAAAEPATDAALLALNERYPPKPGGKHPVARVLASGRADFAPSIDEAWLADVVENEEHLRLVRALGLRSRMTVPIQARGRQLGVLSFGRTDDAHPFTTDDLALAEELGRRAALALDNALLFAAERDAHAEAQTALRVRDEFLASVTHDLKTPLTTIRGRTQLLLRLAERGAVDPARFAEGLHRIDRVTSRMVALVGELVDLSRLETGRSLDLDRRPADLVALLRGTVADHQRLSPRHTLAVDTAWPAVVATVDAARLERVISNLLSNAVKYSPNGGRVAVTLDRRLDADGDWAVISVADDGLGIPAADLPRVFERFHRGGNVAGRIEGAGIGLAGAKQIIEQHGGTIAVTSREGEGTTVTLRLPLQGTRTPTKSVQGEQVRSRQARRR
jgi:PAS domain S-box-containing protein